MENTEEELVTTLKETEEEIETTRKIVTGIFNKYGITQMEVYVNEHKKKDNQG